MERLTKRDTDGQAMMAALRSGDKDYGVGNWC